MDAGGRFLAGSLQSTAALSMLLQGVPVKGAVTVFEFVAAVEL
jgi:hypothetical protein